MENPVVIHTYKINFKVFHKGMQHLPPSQGHDSQTLDTIYVFIHCQSRILSRVKTRQHDSDDLGTLCTLKSYQLIRVCKQFLEIVCIMSIV